MVLRDLKSNLRQKMKNSIIRPKINPVDQKSIFGQKIESSIFRPQNLEFNFQTKTNQKYFLAVANRFLVEK